MIHDPEAFRTAAELSADDLKMTAGVYGALWFQSVLDGCALQDPAFRLFDCTTIFTSATSDAQVLVWNRGGPQEDVPWIDRLRAGGLNVGRTWPLRSTGEFVVTSAPGAPSLERQLARRRDRQPSSHRAHRRRATADPEVLKIVEELLLPMLGDRLWQQVGGPRHLLNNIVSPHFRFATDVDFAVGYSGERALEFKARAPTFMAGESCFGINVGEVRLFGTLLQAGVRVTHFTLAKPRFLRHLPLWQLLAEPQLRREMLLLALEVDDSTLRAIRTQPVQEASRTSRDAKQRRRYYPVPARMFSLVGGIEKGSDVSAGVLLALQGALRQVDGAELHRLASETWPVRSEAFPECHRQSRGREAGRSAQRPSSVRHAARV